MLLHEAEQRFRTDVRVKSKTVVEGNWARHYGDVMEGLKSKVEEMVYGSRQEYMG